MLILHLLEVILSLKIISSIEVMLYIHLGMSFGGDEDSKLGSGTMYATPTFGHKKNGKPRYDFIVVNVVDEKGCKSFALAQVVTFIQIAQADEKGKKVKKKSPVAFLAIVKYLELSVKKGVRNQKTSMCKFPRYKWSDEPLQIIEFASIAGPAFVVPNMSKKVTAGQPKPTTDEFVYVERQFTDRSGWSDISSNMADGGLIFTDLAAQKAFLLDQQSSTSLLGKMVNGVREEGNMAAPIKRNINKGGRDIEDEEDEEDEDQEEEEDEEDEEEEDEDDEKIGEGDENEQEEEQEEEEGGGDYDEEEEC
jgi:hypothetical protein